MAQVGVTATGKRGVLAIGNHEDQQCLWELVEELPVSESLVFEGSKMKSKKLAVNMPVCPGDGFLSIVGDVQPFVDYVYFNNYLE